MVLALLVLIIGSLVYCVLTILAARSYRSAPRPLRTRGHADVNGGEFAPISILKPLSGNDEGLAENLRSFFEQRYPHFEILFAVRRAEDAAVAVVERLRHEYASVPARLIVTGEPTHPNAKVFSLNCMVKEARHDLLVMSDSDVRVTPDMLACLSSEFQKQRAGLITCPYRAVAGRSFWSTLEAIGMNTEFLGGVLVARMLEGMKFALGPTIAARRDVLERIGGFDRLKDYLAEDFMMGKLAAESGFRVILSSYIIEHRIGDETFGINLRHRLRWARSTRRSRSWGYVGQIFTYPLPLSLLLWTLGPNWWPLVLLTAWFRFAAAWVVAWWVLRDPVTQRRWWLVPLQDVMSFCMWIAGFFGNTILWRGRRYYLYPDGRFELRPL